MDRDYPRFWLQIYWREGMREKKLIYRIVLALGLSFAILSALLSLVLVFSLRSSASVLEKEREKQIETEVKKAIEELADSQEGFTRQSLFMSLRGFRDRLLFLFIFDGNKRLVYGFVRWELLSPEIRLLWNKRLDEQDMQAGMGGMMRRPPAVMADEIENLPRLVPIRRAGKTAAYIALRALPVSGSQEWAAFLSRLVPILIAGMFFSLVVAGIVLFFVTREIAVTTQLLADGLDRIGQGQRGISFPMVNIAELSRISRAAASLQEQLLREERIRSQWAQDIAHDLRTPVTALRTQLELFEEGIIAPDSQRISRLMAELGRLEELIDALSVLTRLEDPDSLVAAEKINIPEHIREISSRFLGRDKRELILDTTAASSNAHILCDSSLFTRMIENIIDNAYKHAKGEGPVIISIKSSIKEEEIPQKIIKKIKTERSLRTAQPAFYKEGKQEEDKEKNSHAEKLYVIISISNPGKIEENDLPYIFERLYRGEKSRKSRGSGLGLSIARAIAEKYGGYIQAENTDARVRISIIFPMAE